MAQPDRRIKAYIDPVTGDLFGDTGKGLTASGSIPNAGGSAGVSELNSLTGSISLVGQGNVDVNTVGQNIVISGTATGGGSDHASLSNLDFASAGHTGFASSSDLSSHTSNNSAHHVRYSKVENDAIVAGSNVTVVSGANIITISATGGGGGGSVANALVGSDGVTVTSGDPTDTISGFHAEFVNASGSLSSQITADIATHDAISDAHHVRYADSEAIAALEPTTSNLSVSGVATNLAVDANTTLIITTSGHLQSEIDAIDSSVTLQEAYDNADGTISITEGKPFELTGAGMIAATSGTFSQFVTITGSNVITLGDIDTTVTGSPGAALVGIASLNGFTDIPTVQGNIDIVQSAGHTSGGVITSGTANNTIDVAAGEGYIRKDDDRESRLLRFNWSSFTGISLSTTSINYIGVEYNAGSPQAVARTAYNWNLHQEFPLGNVVSVSGILHIENAPHEVEDAAGLVLERFYRTEPKQRDEITGGLILSESADNNQNIMVSAGAVWDRLNKFSIPAHDTAVSDTFDAFYFDGGAWITDFSRTAWPNTQYNDITSGLTTMTNSRYAVLWFYLDVEGGVDMVYGTAQYNSEAGAEGEGEPSVPDVIVAQGFLIGRIIFQKSATIAALVETVYETAFAGSLATDHGNLTGLADDDHDQYSLVDGTRAFTGTVGGITPATDADLTTKLYVDTDTSALAISGTSNETNISINASDITAVMASGTSHYDDVTIHFTEGSIDHGSIAGLTDDDHTQYSLADGTRTFTGPIRVEGGITRFTGDVVIDNLTVTGTETILNSTTDILDNLTVSGSATFGDEDTPFEDTVTIQGDTTMSLDASRSASSVLTLTHSGAVGSTDIAGTDGAWDINNQGRANLDSVFVASGIGIGISPTNKALHVVGSGIMDGNLDLISPTTTDVSVDVTLQPGVSTSDWTAIRINANANIGNQNLISWLHDGIPTDQGAAIGVTRPLSERTDMRFFTTQKDIRTETMFLGGNDQFVGINTSSPTERLHVVGSGIITGDLTANVLATSSTTSRALSDRFSDIHNVKDYGAIGDGATDDITAINAAVTAANTAGGGIVYFPSGTYLIDSSITIDDDAIYLQGAGSWATEIKASGNFAVIAFDGSVSDVNRGGVRDMTIRGGGNASLLAYGIDLDDCNRTELLNLVFFGCRHAIQVKDVWQVVITDCNVYGAGSDQSHIGLYGLVSDNVANNNAVIATNLNVQNVVSHGVRMETFAGSKFQSCECGGTGGVGFYFGFPQTGTPNCHFLHMINCLADNTTSEGWIFDGTNAVGGVISEIQIVNMWVGSTGADGVLIKAAANITISNILSLSTTEDGIHILDSTRVDIHGGYFTDYDSGNTGVWSGIEIENSGKCLITGCNLLGGTVLSAIAEVGTSDNNRVIANDVGDGGDIIHIGIGTLVSDNTGTEQNRRPIAITSHTTTGSIAANDGPFIDISNGNVTLGLPAVALVPQGHEYHFKDSNGNASGGNITISGSGAELIDAANTKVMSADYASFTLVRVGGKWLVI